MAKAKLVVLIGTVYPGGILITREHRTFVLIDFEACGRAAIIGIVNQFSWVSVVKYKNLATFTLLNPQVFD